MEMREFRRQHENGVRYWQIWVVGDTIYTCKGLVGGAAVKGTDVPGASSRETAEARAVSKACSLIADKLNKNYTEYVPGTDIVVGSVARQELNFVDPPPDGFEIFKPNATPKDGSKEHKKMMDAINRGDEIITRKYNGMKHLLQVGVAGDYRLFTRRMEECSSHYPEVVQSFMCANIPPMSLLACELYVPAKNGTEDFLLMQSLSRSLPDRAVQLQVQDPSKRPNAAVLAPIFWAGSPLVKEMTVFEWMDFMSQKIGPASPHRRQTRSHVHMMKVYFGGLNHAKERVQQEGIEGLVIYDGAACFGDKAFNFKGRPDRPECWKYKPVHEEDFIGVFDPLRKRPEFTEGGSFGQGKNLKKVGNLALYQLDKKGDLVYICNLGGGLTDALRDEITDTALRFGSWVGVVAVEYAERKYLSRGDISNALTFPTLIKIHEDKSFSDVVNPDL